VAVLLVAAGCASTSAANSPAGSPASASPAACKAVQTKYPAVVGKQYKVGIAPMLPGYESIDPSNPQKIVGFDVDMLDAVSACAGYKYTYMQSEFQAMIPNAQSGRIDMIFSNLIATPTRAKQVNFVVYQKDEEALLVPHGNPKHLNQVDDLCGNSIAVFPGTVQQDAAQTRSAACTASGKKPIRVDTYNDYNGCVMGVLTGRSDATIDPVATVTQTVAKYPGKLAATNPIPEFRSMIGIAFPQSAIDLHDATFAAVKAVQDAGIEKALFTKWKQDPNYEAPASLLP
jgi:polar amino acid transport system substrate-binding protein